MGCCVAKWTQKHKKKMCNRKQRYSDEFSARAKAKIDIDGGKARKLWVYPCPLCRGWHLTKKPNSRKVMIDENNLVHESRVVSE